MATIEDILEDCLTRLEAGKSVEECLAAYPGQAVELRELLQAALMAKAAFSALGLRPELKAQVQYRLLAQSHRASRPWWIHRWALALASVLVVLLMGGGTVVAAKDSLPGEPLYAVKLATEELQLRFPGSQLAKAQLQLQLAERRMAEMASLAQKQKPQAVGQAGQRMVEHLAKAERSLKAMGRPDAAEFKAELKKRAPQHRQQLQQMKQRLPFPLPAPAREALDAAKAGQDEDWERRYEDLLERLLEHEEGEE